MPLYGMNPGLKVIKIASNQYDENYLMCGICGIFHFENPTPIDENLLCDMCTSLQHRGPDAKGIWVSKEKEIGLGHRRLTILDNNENANQPMTDKEQSVFVLFNGEIYNHLELREELSKVGALFETRNSDTEILVQGYKVWGWKGLLTKLNGMFAIALWDTKKEILFLARDRLGIKPLYLFHRDGCLLFASEIKALLKDDSIERKINFSSMYHYLTGMVAPAPSTMFLGVQKLPASSYCTLSKDGIFVIEKYWNHCAVGEAEHHQDKGGVVNSVRDKFSNSVHAQMQADVPVGVFLSGGIDSSSILAKTSEKSKEKIKTFTVVFPNDKNFDEAKEAAKVAEHFGTQHHQIEVTQESLEQAWNDIVYHQDEPLGDWVCLPLYFVAKTASEDTKVVLVGEGADEIFFGYENYLRHLQIYKRYWIPFQKLVPAAVRPMISFAASLLGKFSILRPSLADYILRAARGGEFFLGGATTYIELEKHKLLNMKELSKRHASSSNTLIDETKFSNFDTEVIASSVEKMTQGSRRTCSEKIVNLELYYRLPELLLMRSDKMAMAHSLEVRFPFLDQELVEFVLHQREEWKCEQGRTKALFKDAIRGVIPDEVIDRKKVGFGAPIANWLKTEYGDKVEKQILSSKLINNGCFNIEYIKRLFKHHRSGHEDNATKIWLLYNLATWHKLWIEEGGRASGNYA